ncbi:uncharacterized protein A1O5_06794 [Cladophialophora psammophila CBS 110553]|uniref:DUF7580 domain-containing protein n=1 Tax=Cladophialophora psammophila CBS 110553 TaxID=1182543 RepID=W9WP95_9EURO|nr:uncharacterized protein A1O5_06794 [Cladophialophora psammophila CBS 110553]EXJ69723.1 hypothetical protein A1O5_06794 [Cladophialophora psammophila CBS 110553]
MSGVEVVSLVLGAFPLVISLLEHYQEGCETLRDWVLFRRELTHLVNQLNREQILFRQHIEGMLLSINDSDFETKVMMEDLQCDQWKNAELTARLKRKLCGEGEFENYQSSVYSIHENLNKMAQKLKSCEPLDEPADGTSHKGLRLQKQLRKLQFSLRKKRWQEQVVDLGRQIDRIGKLLGEAEALAPARQSRSSTISQYFEQAKKQALSLHKAITKGWTCGCRNDHTFKLVLARRSKGSHQLESGSPMLIVLSFSLRPGMWTRSETLTKVNIWTPTATSMNWGRIQPQVCQPGATTVPTTSTTLSSGLRSRKISFQGNAQHWKHSDLLALTIPDKPLPISDICQSLQSIGEKTCLGYLEDGQGAYHVFHTSPSFCFTSADVDRVISLGAILDKTAQVSSKRIGPQLSRHDRLSIALTMSYAFLELYPTPWLPKGWDKTDVYFFQRKNGDIITEHPFVVCETAPAAPRKEQCSVQTLAGEEKLPF